MDVNGIGKENEFKDFNISTLCAISFSLKECFAQYSRIKIRNIGL